jgi:hypothetical protein
LNYPAFPGSYLSQRQPDVLTEFENIVQTVALDGK